MSVAEIDTLTDDLRSLLDDARRSGESIQIVDQLAERLAQPPDEDSLESEATRAIRRAQTEAALARLKEL